MFYFIIIQIHRFEFQFDDNMNWDNYGSYFHIDHVKQRSLFNIEDDNDRRSMNHWSNLQALEKYENMKKVINIMMKSNKIIQLRF